MVKPTYLFIIIPLLFISISSLFAQSFSLSGEFRTRNEYRDGVRSPLPRGASPSYMVNFRSRIRAEYNLKAIKAKVTLQDSRTTLYPQISATTARTNFLELLFSYSVGSNCLLTLGRQSLEYDDRRIFSSCNWNNTGSSHDALFLKYNLRWFETHLITAWNHRPDGTTSTGFPVRSYSTLNIIRLQRHADNYRLSTTWINDGFERQPQSGFYNNLSYRNTIGGFFEYKESDEKHFSTTLSAYYQFGHDNTKNFRDLSAYMFSIVMRRRFHPFTCFIGHDQYSGTSLSTPSHKSHTFTKLYGANHNYNGYIEFWTRPPHSGLYDTYIGSDIKINSKLKIELLYHCFASIKPIANEGKYLGGECDITFSYKHNSILNLEGGYSIYQLTSATKQLKSITDETRIPQWAFLAITLRFKQKRS